MIGTKFNKWTIIDEAGKDAKSNRLYICKCDCGLEKIQRIDILKLGRSLQCKKCHMANHNHREEILGKKIGRWSILEKFKNESRNEWFYKCQCECGTISEIPGYKLRKNPNAKGCAHCRIKTHGMSYTTTFKIWRDMLARCLNNNIKCWKYYGGRGIKVCDEWFIFENFFKDMGERPSKLTLDRINNNGHYEPGNCRWATMKEQRLNQGGY